MQMAPELMRRRGTREGLELALELAFPGVPLRVEDGGSVTWSLETTESEEKPSEPPSFVVYCDVPLPETRLAAVARLIDRRNRRTSGTAFGSRPRDSPREVRREGVSELWA